MEYLGDFSGTKEREKLVAPDLRSPTDR